MYHIIYSHQCILEHLCTKKERFVLEWAILDSPVSCVYCVHPGEERASVANSGWCGLMIWAARRRARNALCASVRTHHLHTLWIGSKIVWWAVPASWICTRQCSACIVSPFRARAALLCFQSLLPPYPEYSLHLWPLLNKPQLICLKVLKETGKWRRENK